MPGAVRLLRPSLTYRPPRPGRLVMRAKHKDGFYLDPAFPSLAGAIGNEKWNGLAGAIGRLGPPARCPFTL